MHTVLQGVIPYCTNAVMYVLSQEIEEFTCELVNFRMKTLFTMLSPTEKNKPPPLKKFVLGPSCFDPSFTAAETWAFFRYLPLAVGEVVPKDNKVWKMFINLQEIVDLVMAPKHTLASLDYYEELYAYFLKHFKKLFTAINIKPKMHFLLHFPSIVRKNGPCQQFWAMGYERMNGVMKLPAQTMKNFRFELCGLFNH